MPLMIARGNHRKDIKAIYSIHEIDYMVEQYLEILKLAQVFQPNGRYHHIRAMAWGESVTVEGFKFLLKQFDHQQNKKNKTRSERTK